MLESATPPTFRSRFPFRAPSFSFRGARFTRTLFRLFVLVLPLFLFRACFFTYVKPDRIGLRQISLGPNKGLQKELVFPGYRRAISGYETVHTFPRDVQ